jgi:hypothetical protein
MSTTTPRTQETDERRTELADRDVRALTECMAVLPEGDGLFTVVGENAGGEYNVDTRGVPTCTCDDFMYRDPDNGCKHIRRVTFATGDRAIPAWVATEGVDDQLGEHVDGEPRIATTDGGIIVADDDGEIIDEGGTDGRPEDCECLGDHTDDDPLPCWACYRDGFETPNPNAGDDE